MKAKYKNFTIEGTPDEIYTFYIFTKFEPHFEKELKKCLKPQRKDYTFRDLLEELNIRYEEE